MFHSIPQKILSRMKELEVLDAADRIDGTSQKARLRQIPPETGKFISLIAMSAPQGNIIEIGTSAGYSTLWLGIAARAVGQTVTTFEILPEKVALARQTFEMTEMTDTISLVHGDARDCIAAQSKISFCFLDAEKEVYADCYELIIPKLVKGGILVADNALSHKEDLEDMIDRALTDTRVDALVVPIGKGELICRRG